MQYWTAVPFRVRTAQNSNYYLRGTIVNRTYGTHKNITRYQVPGIYLGVFTTVAIIVPI